MFIFVRDQLGLIKQFVQDLAQLGGSGTQDRFTRDQQEVVSGCDSVEMRLDRSSHYSFGPVSLDGFSD